MKLLVDIGNSRLKWALAQNGTISQAHQAIDYRLPEFAAMLLQVWGVIERPQQVAIASVAASTVFDVVNDALGRLWPDVQLFTAQSTGNALGVCNAYQQPEKLGVDRWLALLAAHSHYSGNVCIVDCGSAITVDVLDQDGRHLGGLISPGLTMMRKALVADAAALQFDDQVAALALAGQTSAAIANGTLMAAAGLISIALGRLSGNYRLLLTGGDAEVVAAGCTPDAIVDGDLVFKGLLALADQACSP